MAAPAMPSGVIVRQLREDDLSAADRIFRLAFGTFMGVPDPLQFGGDADYIRTRWRAQPQSAFAAESEGELAGSILAAHWGSFASFGPLTIRPDLWDRGIGKLLLEPVMEAFTRWGAVHTGLFTFAQSQKHMHLYQKFGFWPRFLTAVMSKSLTGSETRRDGVHLSRLHEGQRAEAVDACRELTDSIFAGLDVTVEIESVARQRLGDTALVYDNSRLMALAVCHCGPRTEAGSSACYIKFGAVRPGGRGRDYLNQLLDACEALALERGQQRVVAGMNLAREGAFRALVDRGFRTDFQGVAMQRPNEPGFNRPDAYVIDDWR